MNRSPTTHQIIHPERYVRTPAEVLESIREWLREQSGADTELLDILEAHLLTMEQGTDAVEQAAKEIEGLAEKRVEGHSSE